MTEVWMSPDHVVAAAILVSAAAHGWFLTHATRVVPPAFAAFWIVVATIGVHADRVGLPIWVSVVCAIVAAVVAVVGLPRLVGAATRAEQGVSIVESVDEEITAVREAAAVRRAEREADHRILHRAGARRHHPASGA